MRKVLFGGKHTNKHILFPINQIKAGFSSVSEVDQRWRANNEKLSTYSKQIPIKLDIYLNNEIVIKTVDYHSICML